MKYRWALHSQCEDREFDPPRPPRPTWSIFNVMNKPLFTVLLVTASLMPVTSGIAWSDDALSNVGTPAAAQSRQLPVREPAPGRYPPPPAPNPGWQAGPWGSPRWGYRQPPSGYRASAELDRLQEELAAYRAELDKARKELQQGEIAMQEVRATLDRAHTEQHQNLDLKNALSERLAEASAENVALQSQVTQLTTELATANTSLVQGREQVAALNDERDQLKNALTSRDEQLATLRDELQATGAELQQARSGMDASRTELAESQAQAQAYKNRLDDLNARLEDQQQAMQHARQLLAEMNSSHDNLRADLSASNEELTRVQTTLAKAQEQAEQLRQARRDSISADSPGQPVPAENGAKRPDAAVEVAALESVDTAVQVPAEDTPTQNEAEDTAVAPASTAGTAAADTDRDGVPDSIDLCPATAEAVAVASTGCAVNAAIPLKGVNFRYNSIELTGDARLALDRVAGILGKQADIRLEVAGHTDSQGNEARHTICGYPSIERKRSGTI